MHPGERPRRDRGADRARGVRRDRRARIRAARLYGWTPEDLHAAQVEILVQVAATDENYGEVVRARSSYVAEEVVWDARFANIFEETDSGVIEIDLKRLHETVKPAGIAS